MEEVRGTKSTTHLRMYHVHTGKQLFAHVCGHTESYSVKDGDGAILAMSFFSDGHFLVASHEGETARAKTTCRGRAVLYHISEGFHRIRLIGEHPEKILDVAVSSDGRYVGTAGQDRRGGIWPMVESNGSSGGATWLAGHTSNVRSIDFSRDSTLVATAGHDGTGRVYQADGGRCIAVLEGHDHWVYRIRFSPSSNQLATSSADATIKLWQSPEATTDVIAEAEPEQVLVPMLSIKHGSAAVRDVAWQNEAILVATSGCSSAILCCARTGARLRQMHHRASGMSPATRDQGLTLAVIGDIIMVSSREAVQLWDLTAKAGDRILWSHALLSTFVFAFICSVYSLFHS